jgi:type II secretory pathway pseudopilin PulG
MQLHGQARFRFRAARDAGYAMAALLVAMSITALMLTMVMPVWKQMVQREKEAELVFRGEQYVHAIVLFQRKYANAFPPNVDVLVEQRFLRKKFKDPITGEDFQTIAFGAQTAPPGGTPTIPGASTTGPGAPARPGTNTPFGGRGGAGAGAGAAAPAGGVVSGVQGVTSRSPDASIRLYKGRSHYNEWSFVYVAASPVPGGGVPGAPQPGQPAGGPGGAGPLGGRGGQGGQGGQGGRGGQQGRPGGPGGGFPTTPQTPRGRF